MPDPTTDSKLLAAALRASQTLDLGEFLDRCTEGIGSLLLPESVHAYLETEEGSELELRSSWPDPRRRRRRPPSSLGVSVVGLVGPEGGLVDARRLKLEGSRGAPGAAGEVLILPIGGLESKAGLFLALPGASGPLGAADAARARAFVQLVEPVLENLRLVTDLRETAVRDDIVGCFNRRHFESFMEEEIARARRFRSQVSILFLDMDDLKGVNTAFGHAMGSRTLHEVAARVGEGIRKIDKLFRFGGDEFCIVLPETDAQGAFEVGERTRRSIAGSPFLVAEVGGVKLSASLGVATFPEHGETAEAVVQAADRAMQAVKISGKNAIGLAEPNPGKGSRREAASTPRREKP